MEKRLMPLKVPFKKEHQEILRQQKDLKQQQKQVPRGLPTKPNKSKQTQDSLPQQENVDFLGKVTP